MTGKNSNVAVVYLAWLPYGINYFKDFIDSYLQYDSGYQHKLVICFNGMALPHPDSSETYIQYLKAHSLNASQFVYVDSGQDIHAYNLAATEVEADFFLFLNTYSRLLASNWLLHYVSNWKDNCGIIGATGSYANYLTATRVKVLSDLRSSRDKAHKINLLKYYVKIFLLYRNKFKKFPSPHIRTNAFYVRKDTFLAIRHKAFTNKMRAYFFENGRQSLTEQVIQKGLKCFIVDKKGKVYDIPDWGTSKVFWDSNQENLLVSDNQTRMYESADEAGKKNYRKMAWNY